MSFWVVVTLHAVGRIEVVGMEPSIGPVYRGYGIVHEHKGMVIVYRGPGRGRGRNWVRKNTLVR